jgi:hypothetical protein
MAPSPYDALVRKAARAICAKTKLSRPGPTEVIYDAPDDLMWDQSTIPPRAQQRWRLYEEPGKAALEAAGIFQIAEALIAIRAHIKKGQNAVAPQIAEHAFRTIDDLARGVLDRLQDQ